MRIVALFLSYALSLWAAGVALERIERDSLGRAVLFCSDTPAGWHSELSADKQRLLITLPGTTLLHGLRPRSWTEGLIREVYPKQDTNGLLLYLSFARPSGYSIVWLPYSRCLVVTPVRWEQLSPAEDLYHSALLALELGSEAVADSLLREAASRGSADAATLLAVRSLRAGQPVNALGWIRAAVGQSTLPDYFAVIAQLAELAGMTSYQAWAYSRFRQLTGRELPELPSVASDSLATLADAMLTQHLPDSAAFPRPSAASAEPTPAPATGDSSSATLSATGTPEWLLVGAPFVFALAGIVLVGWILRRTLRAARRHPAPPETPTGGDAIPPFPAYVRSALDRYRSAEAASPQSAPPVATAAPPSPAPEPRPHAEPPPAAPPPSPAVPMSGYGQLPSEFVHLWRQRRQHRLRRLQHLLQQLSSDALPESAADRARLARKLHVPPQSLELLARLRSAPIHGTHQRTQEAPSFVSASTPESNDEATA